MLSWLRELWAMRRYKRVNIVEFSKREVGINVFRLIGKPFPTVEEAFTWVFTHVKYVRENKDYWQTPCETLTRLAGDCEDGAILLASLFAQTVPDPWRVFVYLFEKPAHAVVVYRDKVYDWTNPSLREIPADWSFWYCFNFRNAYTTKQNFERWTQCKK